MGETAQYADICEAKDKQIGPFFSVVMPVYQVEEYIHQAVDSVLNQTFQDFELILVDDCSTDASSNIMDDYEKRDYRVRTIRHDTNMGLSAARNTGIEHAQGKYILFWDSDDEVDSEILEEIYNSIQINPAQLVVYGLVEEFYNKEKKLIHAAVIKPEGALLKDPVEIHHVVIKLETLTLYGYAWNKCYHLEYLKEQRIRFEPIKMIEDIKFNVMFCQNIERMNVLHIAPYHYKKRVNNSLTRAYLPDYYSLHRERIRLVFEQYQRWGMCSDEVKKELGGRFVRYIYSTLERNCDRRQGLNNTKRRNWLVQLYKDELYKELIPYADSHKLILKVMYRLIQNQNTMFCLICGRIIYIVKNKLPGFFVRLQQRR